ncbi:MAG: TonB-dependent receptor [Verrucomicrobia bacterium]|nr:TonB-dependent receptor [Verrucomicrobiota bacterium]
MSCFSARLVGQQETSAALAGLVFDKGKTPIGAVRVVVKFIPTGSRFQTDTNAKGVFSLAGLPVGGPYALSFELAGYETRRMENIVLGLGETRLLEIVIVSASAAVIKLDKVEVVASREASGPGPHTALTRDEIEGLASLENSLNEYAARDPRVIYIDPERGELAAAGQNSRFNSLSVDGVRINDQFGVTPNGFPSQGNPLAMETIEAVNVEVSPYDVHRGGFTGATIDAVTRSGTNRFRGSVYYQYRDQNWRAAHPVTRERDPFTDETFGFTFGGPFWRDHLFFFSGYEHSQRIEPAPSAGFEPSAAALARIQSVSANYGYNPGALVNPGKQNKEDDKYLAKIDWRINQRHRLSLRYSLTQGHQPTFSDYTTSGRVSLSGHWYESEQNLEAWTAQLFSQWTNRFQTECKVASHHYESERTPNTRFPQVRINGVASEGTETGSVFIGAEESSQVNTLDVVNNQAGLNASWLLGRHRVFFGAEIEDSEFQNTYLQNAWGSYTFASIAAYEAGKPTNHTYQYMLPGHSPAVAWGYSVGSVFLQDTVMATRRLTLMMGVRFDYPWADSKPHRNTLVEETFGRRNDRTIDGAYVLGPRGSFTYKFGEEDRTRLRGGAGVFQGRAPGVWLSNAYSNDGFASAVNTKVSGFSPDPDNQPQGNPSTARQRVDLLDDKFHLPTIARANLGLDQKLPWQGITVSAELVRTWMIEGLTYKNLNLRRTGTGPDGRTIYGERTKSFGLVSNSQYQNTAFTDVYLLTNTTKGEAAQATISLKRPLRKHWGFSISYTRSSADEVSSVTASTADTNFSSRASLDPNDDRLGTTNYTIRDRVLASFTLKFALVKRFDTKVALHYEGRSGRPYSFIFGTDVNGDSSSYDNDLFYVPTGRDDPNVRWADPKQADAYFAFADATPALKRFSGRVVPRNSETSYYQHRYDLKFTQEIPLHGRVKGELFLDIINVANLINTDWGRVYAASFPYGLAVANGSYDPTTNQYVYRYTGAKAQTLQTAPSRWQMQGGARLKF